MKHVGYYNIVFILVVVFVFVFNACQPEATCRESVKTGLVCAYSEAYLDETMQVRYRTTWDSITVIGIGKTDSLYANSKNVQKINLPLRNDIDSTLYSLTYHNLTDTLIIFHSNQQQFISVECGCTYHHGLQKMRCTQHWIDSIAILDTLMTRAEATNITILHFNEK